MSPKKHLKMRNTNSNVISEESKVHNSNGKGKHPQLSQGNNGSVSSDRLEFQLDDSISVKASPVVDTIDLNRMSSGNAIETDTTSIFGDKVSQCASTRGISLDLNAEDVESSVNHDSCHSFHRNSSKSWSVSECGSTSGSATNKDPLTVWKEMKQNGFLSTSHGGIMLQGTGASLSNGAIATHRQREQKIKAGTHRKRMEMGKKDFAQRLTKTAAPTGLLNGLNLGIINHVRNKKQVHSIIQALVMSESFSGDNSRDAEDGLKRCSTKVQSRNENAGRLRLGSPESGSFSALSGDHQINVCPVKTDAFDVFKVDKTTVKYSVPHPSGVSCDESLTWKTLPFEFTGCSNTLESDPTSISKVSLLSVRASSVAGRWLELLNQDIKGRLSALRRSRKRVKSVITTELPFIMSKEYASTGDQDVCMTSASLEMKDDSVASSHMAHWGKLFNQMEKALSEEERQLESWLHDVRKMQLHCERALQNSSLAAVVGSHLHDTPENCVSEGSATGLAVRAAAASIYSTCNFLLSKDNSPLYLSSH